MTPPPSTPPSGSLVASSATQSHVSASLSGSSVAPSSASERLSLSFSSSDSDGSLGSSPLPAGPKPSYAAVAWAQLFPGQSETSDAIDGLGIDGTPCEVQSAE